MPLETRPLPRARSWIEAYASFWEESLDGLDACLDEGDGGTRPGNIHEGGKG